MPGLPPVKACANHRDRFPCRYCNASVPAQCPRYVADYGRKALPVHRSFAALKPPQG